MLKVLQLHSIMKENNEQQTRKEQKTFTWSLSFSIVIFPALDP